MNINGKEVQTRYGMLATDYFLSKVELFQNISYYSTIGLAHIIWGGVMNWYEVKQQPYPVTFEEVYDFVENAQLNGNSEAVQEQFSLFESSQALKKKTEQLTEALEETKKKMIPMAEGESPLKQD